MILITGASSGIGEACALEFAKLKRELILWARRSEKLETLTQRLLELGATKVHFASIDVGDRKSIESEIEKHTELYSRVDILINGAGLALGMETFQNLNLDDADRMVDTNLKGVLFVTRLMLPFMIKKNQGHIIHLGSVAGRHAYPKGHVYCATKAAIRSLNESLRMDLLGTNIRMTEIAPGMVETEFSEVRLKNVDKAKQVYAGMSPLVAQDIAEAIVWSANRPAHVNIQEMVIYPTSQASPTLVYRKP